MDSTIENLIGFLDIIGFFFISYYAFRLFLFKWYVQVIVCLVSIYILIKEGYMILFQKISQITGIFRISGICIGAFKYCKLFIQVLNCFSITSILNVIKEFFCEEIIKWLKSNIFQELSDLISPFIKTKITEFINTKLQSFFQDKVKTFINDNYQSIKISLISFLVVIIIYFISWIYWPLRFYINIFLTILILFAMFYYRKTIAEKILTYLDYFEKVLLNIPSKNRYILYFIYCIYFAQTSFSNYINSYMENNILFSEKSFTSQTHNVMISVFPIIIIVRYLTSNILWFISLSIICVIGYFVIFKTVSFFENCLKNLDQFFKEIKNFLVQLKDVSEEIILNAVMHTLKILTAVQKGIIFLGRKAYFFDSLRESKANDHLNNDENKEKEEEKEEEKKNENNPNIKKDKDIPNQKKDDKNRKFKENEKEIKAGENVEREKEQENIKNDNDKEEEEKESESNQIIEKIASIIDKNKVKICLTLIIYTFFQNFFIAYAIALLNSLAIFIFYALYQLLLEKISNNKLNYYGVMWMFYFTNQQIIVSRIWLKFFGYHSFMYGVYTFKGYSVLQILYLIIQFIRITINTIEIIYYACFDITKQITSNEIIATMIFPF